jgi:hypothetical protein
MKRFINRSPGIFKQELGKENHNQRPLLLREAVRQLADGMTSVVEIQVRSSPLVIPRPDAGSHKSVNLKSGCYF